MPWLRNLLFGKPPVTGSRHTESNPRRLTKHYRMHGCDNYTLEYLRQPDGTYKLYCRAHPAFPTGLSQAVTDCHLYATKEICVAPGKEPKTFDKAQAIGMYFCNGFSEYIRTGKFPNHAVRINV